MRNTNGDAQSRHLIEQGMGHISVKKEGYQQTRGELTIQTDKQKHNQMPDA